MNEINNPDYFQIIKYVQRADALLNSQKIALEYISQNRPLFETLHHLVQMIENQYEGTLCSILITDHSNMSFKVGVKASEEKNFSRESSGVTILPPYMGPCCLACHKGESVLVHDIQSDDRWQRPWKDWALNNKVKSCYSHPIIDSTGKVLGSFAMYNKENRDPTKDNIYHIEHATLLAALAIERKEIEESKTRKIKEQEIINRELTQSLLLRDEYISVTSHELKTPLSALKLQNQLLQRKLNSESSVALEDLKKFTSDSSIHIARLQSYIDSILDSTRIQNTGLQLHTTQFNLSEFIEQIIDRHSHLQKESLCLVETKCPQNISVTWDHLRMDQVITNILVNAFKYAPHSKVELVVEVENNDIKILIKDSGYGIPASDLKRIFDRYYRSSTHVHETPGSGLGLYIVEKIIQAHQGSIKAESKIGEGTQFKIKVPAIVSKV